MRINTNKHISHFLFEAFHMQQQYFTWNPSVLGNLVQELLILIKNRKYLFKIKFKLSKEYLKLRVVGLKDITNSYETCTNIINSFELKWKRYKVCI
jgi:hypothetical protein